MRDYHHYSQMQETPSTSGKIMRFVIILIVLQFIIIGGVALRGWLTEPPDSNQESATPTRPSTLTTHQPVPQPGPQTSPTPPTPESTPLVSNTDRPVYDDTEPELIDEHEIEQGNPTPGPREIQPPVSPHDQTIYPAQPGPVRHRVSTGDTWTSIATAYSCSVEALKTVNKQSIPMSGANVIIPLRKGDTHANVTPPTLQNTSESASDRDNKGGTYIVKSGDTLSRIAKKHGVSLASLQKTNKIKDPSKLRVGQTLIIPSK